MGKHVVETHEFDLDGVWLPSSPVAIVLLSDCFEEGLGTDVINDGAIGRFMRRDVAFANRFFDETLRIPAPLLAQKEVVLTANSPKSVDCLRPGHCSCAEATLGGYSTQRS